MPPASWARMAAARTEHHGVVDRVDIVTGTFGKALGGASGGVTSRRAGRSSIWLRQRSRPYLFSNSLPPPIVAATLTAIDMVERGPRPARAALDNVAHFRERMAAAGFDLAGADHAIIPVMLGEARLAAELADAAAGARAST